MTVIDPTAEAARPKIRVAVCIPARDDVAAGFAFDLARMVGATAAQRRDIEIRLFMNRSSLLPKQRHELVLQALDAESTHILWLDSDMRFPKHLLVGLLAHDEPIVGCSYPRRSHPVVPVAVTAGGLPVYTDPSDPALVEVAAVGFGALLIDTDVFRGLPAPWFLFDFTSTGEYVGEDVFFFKRVSDAGLRVLVDPVLSEQVAHIGELEFTSAHARAYVEDAHGTE